MRGMAGNQFALWWRWALIVLLVIAPRAGADLPAAVQGVRASVVTIRIFDSDRHEFKTGGGFLIEGGRVVTCYHVIKEAHSARVRFADGKEAEVEAIAGEDYLNDLVILTIGANAERVAAVRIARTVTAGEHVFVVGNPLDGEESIKTGAVAEAMRWGGRQVLGLTVAESPEYNGSPVVDERGRVVGVAKATAAVEKPINLAIPANLIGRINTDEPVDFSDWANNRLNKKAEQAVGRAVEILTTAMTRKFEAIAAEARRADPKRTEKSVASWRAELERKIKDVRDGNAGGLVKANGRVTIDWGIYDFGRFGPSEEALKAAEAELSPWVFKIQNARLLRLMVGIRRGLVGEDLDPELSWYLGALFGVDSSDRIALLIAIDLDRRDGFTRSAEFELDGGLSMTDEAWLRLPEWNLQMANCFFRLHNSDQAIKSCQVAVKVAQERGDVPGNNATIENCKVELATLYARVGQLVAAKNILEPLIKTGCGWRCDALLGMVYFDSGDRKLARAQYNKVWEREQEMQAISRARHEAGTDAADDDREMREIETARRKLGGKIFGDQVPIPI